MQCLKPGCIVRPRKGFVCASHAGEAESLLRDRLVANHKKGFHAEGTGGDHRCPLCEVGQLKLDLG